MPLTQAILDRLAAIGVTSEADVAKWREMADSPRVSDEAFLGLLRAREAETIDYRRLMPNLRAFVAACRAADPIPAASDLTPAEREQGRILGNLIRQFAAGKDGQWFGRPTPFVAAIVRTIPAALPAAQEAFARIDVVVITSDEWHRWRKDSSVGFGDSDGDSPWYRSAWWIVREVQLSDDGEIWLLATGQWYGSLAASGYESYWSWDGTKAQFLRDGKSWDS